MWISAKAVYACLAVIELANHGNDDSPRRIRDIAEAQDIPERYLVQILLQLKVAGLVQSVRGSVGGYHLVRRAEEITVADIIAAIDGHGHPARKNESSVARDLCDLISRARAAGRDVLASTSIAQLTVSGNAGDWVL